MSQNEYNYESFSKDLLEEDTGFGTGPEPGDPAPDFELETVDGGLFRLSRQFGKSPVLIEFGSMT